ncbi:hypothetical protein D3C75_270550 [compost metagenome]
MRFQFPWNYSWLFGTFLLLNYQKYKWLIHRIPILESHEIGELVGTLNEQEYIKPVKMTPNIVVRVYRFLYKISE